MVIEIDFNSDEAIYVQLMNQIIFGIATSRLQEGSAAFCPTDGRHHWHQYAYGQQGIFPFASGRFCKHRPQERRYYCS